MNFSARCTNNITLVWGSPQDGYITENAKCSWSIDIKTPYRSYSTVGTINLPTPGKCLSSRVIICYASVSRLTPHRAYEHKAELVWSSYRAGSGAWHGPITRSV